MRTAAYICAFLIPVGVVSAAGESPANCSADRVQLSGFVSENSKHLSLEGAPPVPVEGVVVTLACTRGEDGSLQACRAACASEGATSPFLAAAMKRATTVRFMPMPRPGATAPGESFMSDWKILPSDRFTLAPVDLSRGDQVVFTAEPRGQDLHRFYPSEALELEQEAVLDVACMVREDLRAECPHIVVTLSRGNDEDIKHEFEDAARDIARIFRVAPQTKDSKSPVGTWFRKRIRFVLE